MHGAKDKHTVTGELGSTQTETKQDESKREIKLSYPSGSNKRKKEKSPDKYLATLPKMTTFFTTTVGDTDMMNNSPKR